jgi:hypothetical protein
MTRLFLLTLVPMLFVLAIGAQTFENVAAAAGIDHVPSTSGYMGGGCAWFDFNNDGWDDLYLTGCLGTDRLYLNNGDGTFSESGEAAGLGITADRNTLGVVSGDIDNDGDRDILVTTWKYDGTGMFAPNFLLRNNGDGTVSDITEAAGITSAAFTMAAGFLDVKLDGLLDIYLGNYIEEADFLSEDGLIVGFNHTCFEDELYINNGDNTFTESAAAYGVNNAGCTLAVAATDYDLDGDSDLMVANDFGPFLTPNKLYRNEYPLPYFSDVGAATGADLSLYGMGIGTGDYDEDGDLDYYITNLGPNAFLQQGGGVFADVASGNGTANPGSNGLLNTGWGTVFFDYDNNTWLDLAVSDGRMPSADFLANEVWDDNPFYVNNTDGSFSDLAAVLGVADTNISRGLAISDYNKDGFEDMALVNIENNLFIGNEAFVLYKNSANGNNHISFTLEGTSANRDGYGSVLTLYAGGRSFIREHSGTNASHVAQHSAVIHFGLGSIVVADSLVVRWPGGTSQTVIAPEINMTHHIVQEAETGVGGAAIPGPVMAFPVPATDHVFVAGLNYSGLLSWKLQSVTGGCVEQKTETVQGAGFLVHFSKPVAPGFYHLIINAEAHAIQIPLIIH